MQNLLNRRRFLVSTVAFATTLELQRAAWALGFGQHSDVCTLAAEQEEGPYYIEDELHRSDVTENRPGVPLALRIVVLDARHCLPIPNAAVEIWSCDALGRYSGFTEQSSMGPGGPGPDGPPPDFDPRHGGPPPAFDPRHAGPPPGPPEGFGPPPVSHPTDKLTFLRGVQRTNADGSVAFRTIIPGFYQGRTNHIHFRVRVNDEPKSGSSPAGHTAHMGQIFLPEQTVADLMLKPPYSDHRIRRTTPAEDGVFTDQHGELSVASLRPLPSHTAGHGFTAELIAAVDPTAVPQPARRRGGPAAMRGSLRQS